MQNDGAAVLLEWDASHHRGAVMRIICILVPALAACSSPLNVASNGGSVGSEQGFFETIHATCGRDGLAYDIGTDDPGVLAGVQAVVADAGAPAITFSGSVVEVASCVAGARPCCAAGEPITITVPSSSPVDTWVVDCAAQPADGPFPGSISAWHDFGSQANELAFKARVVAFASRGTGSSSVTWPIYGSSGDVAYVSCVIGQTVAFVLLP
jgi:hypothetical protein